MIDDKIIIYADQLKVNISGVDYIWSGGLGNILTSFEKRIKNNELRAIGNIIFRARTKYSRLFRQEVCWCPVEEIDIEWMRKFKKKLFNIKD